MPITQGMAHANTGGSARRPAVLLVENDDLLASVVTALLTTLGDVHWTPDGEEAERLLATRPWDAVLADVELPGMSGLDLVRAAKAAQPHVATLILSGHASFDYAVEAIRAGADDYVTKPVEPGQLVTKVEELIALTRERRAADREIVLAIGAHPDDVEIGVGGLLLRHVAAGHDVTILTLSGGEAGGEPAERAAESRRAAELLGARLVHADLMDRSVSEGGSTIATIKGVIDEIGPGTIYTHTARDVHQDHRGVHSATLVAARGIPRIYCYQAPSTTVEFLPTRFVAIDDFVERKLDVIDAYASQTAVRHYLDPELMRATARYWARFTQSRYVEPLEIIRESDVSTTATQPAAEPSKVTIPTMSEAV